jgi:hypothetical protein
MAIKSAKVSSICIPAKEEAPPKIVDMMNGIIM